MAIRKTLRKAPRKQLVLDQIYAEQGGVQQFVLTRLDAGDRVEDIADTLATASEESPAKRTLYSWISGWKAKKDEKEQEVTA